MNKFKEHIFKKTTDGIVSLSCKKVNVTISPIDADDSDDGTVNVFYTDCFLIPTFQAFPDAGTYNDAFCAINSTSFSLSYQKGGSTLNASNSVATLAATNC